MGAREREVDGIVELAIASGTASALFDNDGVIDINALAFATGTGAGANASVDFGIVQIAIGGTSLSPTRPMTA